jgi:hypothetical protein
MQPYANLSGESPILNVELRPDAVVVEFRDKPPYVYSHASAGALHIERMKLLALAGRGLSTYISQHVHSLYEH